MCKYSSRHCAYSVGLLFRVIPSLAYSHSSRKVTYLREPFGKVYNHLQNACHTTTLTL